MFNGKNKNFILKLVFGIVIIIFVIFAYLLVNSANNSTVLNDNISPKPDNNTSNKKIVLEDRTKGNYCAQAIEYFYEDKEYRYYFTCIKSNSMYVIVNDIEYKLVYALKNNIVTIKDLENNGYKFLKESKNIQSK